MTSGHESAADERRETAAVRLLADSLRRGRPACLRVRGRCMEPLVADGDWVATAPAKPRTAGAAVGRLALALDSRGELVCHRVLERTVRGLCLAGDRDLAVERYPAETVFALVESVRRGERELRLDERGSVASLWRGFDRWLAALHRRSWERRGTRVGRLLEGLRRRLLDLRGLAWRSASMRADPTRVVGGG